MNGVHPAALLACISARWTPQIGDPDAIGWIIVVVYALTGLLAGAVAVAGPRDMTRRVRLFWGMTAALMLFLSVNKQLDLQSALTAAGRCVAQIEGWYGARRGVQVDFILGLLAGAVVLLSAGLIALRRDLLRNLVALLGLVCVATFVLVRAVGFHHVDAFLRGTFHGARMNSILELSGLVLISLNATLLLVVRGARRR